MKLRLWELSERTARFVEDLDSARDRAAITQKELNNCLSEQMNKAMYVFSIVAAIFLPLGLLNGLLIVAVVALIFGTQVDGAAYVQLFRWPAILSVDGIVLVILTLFPLVSTGAGVQIGWRLGKHIEEMQLYWFW